MQIEAKRDEARRGRCDEHAAARLRRAVSWELSFSFSFTSFLLCFLLLFSEAVGRSCGLAQATSNLRSRLLVGGLGRWWFG
jgi:hypothetical protein